jgi:hypothetical protein
MKTLGDEDDYPIFWALWDETPSGCTFTRSLVQVLEERAISRRELTVEYFPIDTGGSLLEKS